MDFTEIEHVLFSQGKGEGDVAGMVLLSGNDVGIFYNEKDEVNIQRFTIAHELVHCCLNGNELADNYIKSFPICRTIETRQRESDSF